MFKTVAAVPDKYQEDRIAKIMECNTKLHPSNDHGIGLLIAPRSVQNSRPSQHYSSSDYQYAYDRYIEAIKELARIRAVYEWLHAHRSLWAWMERDLSHRSDEASHRQPTRVEYPRRDEVNAPAPILDSHAHSDSEMPLSVHSDDDDSDSYAENAEYGATDRVAVSAAGKTAVNGIYELVGSFDNVGKFAFIGPWKEQTHQEFSMFRCNTSNGSKHWYISIVPVGVQPGTSTDIDFYSAPVSETDPDYPPERGWTKANEGEDPVPVIRVIRAGDAQHWEQDSNDRGLL